MKLVVQKNHLAGQIWYRSLGPVKKQRQKFFYQISKLWTLQVFAGLDNSAFTGPANDEMGAALKFDSADYYPYVYYRIPTDIIE